MAKMITIEIDENGDTKIATKGFVGGACKVETADIEKALGATTSDYVTEEFRMKPKLNIVKAGQK
jgi:hypothetical protein